MKKIILLTLLFFTLGVLFAKFTQNSNAGGKFINTDPGSDSRCLQIKVKFTADTSWRETGSKRYIYAGCDGQGAISSSKKKLNPPGCTGGLVKLKPGETATLGRCSCFFKKDGGCLKIGKEMHIDPQKSGWRQVRKVYVDKPLQDSAACKVVLTDKTKTPPKKVSNIKYFCGSNEDRFNVGININCKPTPTPTKTPTPTGVCVTPAPVLNVKITCPNCSQETTPTPITDEQTFTSNLGDSCGQDAGPATGNYVCAEGLVCSDVNSNGIGTCVSSLNEGGNQ